ncbi:YdeI/OmpD-associated family protein [Echinicola shivajiensis]|uniref:YdeI/OmpD-associated family protein n=1 Tax=Echinicola shivajiensis TaxID=1035916 RepID=UPI001FEB4911|nr:YdeI/OmpD-associated family protein [Echinicola shivajiensis]
MEEYYPANCADWQKWLEANHHSKQSVWIVFYNKNSGKDSISWSEAVETALCFGWIDSKKQTIDEFSYRQFYSKRKPNSTWSKINKDKVQMLIETGQMMPAGFESIEIAKQNGLWTILDEVEELIVPKDLEATFITQKGSKDYFLSLNKSMRKTILQWIVLAKIAETRQNRINQVAELAAKGQKPKQFG